MDGQPIAPEDFSRLVAEALPLADRVARRLGQPTEFELLTAIMFRRFAEVRPDVALVEVGLGGRLDATHAWDGGVAVITNVGLDHTDRLGATVPAIAREKAAIVDARRPCRDRRRPARRSRSCAAAAPGLASRWPLRPPPPVLGLDARRAHRGPAAAGCHRGGAPGPPPGGQRRGCGRAAGRARGRRDRDGAGGGAAGGLCDRPLAGSPGAARGSPCRGAADGRSSSMARTTRTGPPRSRRPWTTCAPTSPGATSPRRFRSRSSGRRWWTRTSRAPSPPPPDRPPLPARRSSAPPWTCRGRWPPLDLAAAWRAALPGGTVLTAPDPGAALDLALARAEGPVVVAGSLYLVGAARTRLVDDPGLRDPVPA